MLRLLSTIIGHPVISQREGRAIATVREAICDPASAKVIAYRVSTAPGLLATADVLAYLDEGLVVADDDAIQSEDDLIRVKRLGGKRTKLTGLHAVTEGGKRIGTVNDVLLETEGMFPVRFHVQPGILRRLFTDERIIPRERVVRMTPRQIVVRYDGDAPSVTAEPEIAQ